MIIQPAGALALRDRDRSTSAIMNAMLPGRSPLKGRLLVATPVLDDPNFHRSVIFMIEHHAEGALGLILNRPSTESLHVPLDAWVRVQSEPPRIFSGGPVEPDALIALARTDEPVDPDDGHLAPLTTSIVSADLAADPDHVAASISALRVFRGTPAGHRASWRWRSSPGRGWCSTRTHPMCSRRTRTSSGAPCCAASPAASAGWPRSPTTSARTDRPAALVRSRGLKARSATRSRYVSVGGSGGR